MKKRYRVRPSYFGTGWSIDRRRWWGWDYVSFHSSRKEAMERADLLATTPDLAIKPDPRITYH